MAGSSEDAWRTRAERAEAELAYLRPYAKQTADICSCATKLINALAAGCSDKAAQRRIQNLTTAVFRLRKEPTP